jgi:glycosyltransferase involved in cell wall biosynthesis
MTPTQQTLAVVVPAYNEGDGLRAFHARLAAVFDQLDLQPSVLYVDDGSRDDTWAVIESLAAADPRVGSLRLSRNFGKELALTAGLDRADADAVIVIDADLQDPPELIPAFIAKWREGHDAVFGTRLEREGETWVKKATAAMFYRLIGRLSKTPVPRDTGAFSLQSRRAIDAQPELRERHR